MKTRITKSIALLLTAVMLILSFAGCGSSSPIAISFGSTEFTANMFSYWMSTYKAALLYSMLGTTTDNPQFWTAQLSEGVTYGDYLGAMAATDIMSKAVCHELFSEYGLELTNEELNAIDARIDNLIQSVGSKAALNSVLSAYNVNIDILRDINIIDTKVSKVQEYLYGENGPEAATDDELKEFYNTNYYRAKYIFISTKFEYERDDNGAAILDEETSTYKTRELTEDEITEKKALIDQLQKDVAAGEDFDELVLEYSMDMGMQQFPGGYYFTTASTYVTPDVVTATTQMQIGDVKTITIDDGTFIIKRYELEPDAYKDETIAPFMFSNLTAQVNTIKLQTLVSSYSNSIVLDANVISSYPIAYCTPNFYY